MTQTYQAKAYRHIFESVLNFGNWNLEIPPASGQVFVI
jgi:hypothetical protein